MAFHSFLEKSILLLLFTSVLFGLVTVCTPVAPKCTDNLIRATSSLPKNCSAGTGSTYYSPKCTKPLVRQEWYTLSDQEKKNYLNAVICLSKKPSLSVLHSKYPGTVNRLDDFTAVHSSQSLIIHFVGFFLHWHRYMLAVYENVLRKECGYTGAQPYWNVANDLARTNDTSRWGIFSNTTGFGGNGPFVSHKGAPNPFNVTGATGGGCIQGGLFGTGSTYKTHLGPTPNTSINTPRCLIRDFAPPLYSHIQQNKVNELLSLQTYALFGKDITSINGLANTGIHGFGHIAFGGILGQLSDLFNSPGDPLFYMHHANLDRVWWQWQVGNLDKRLCDIGGPTVPFDYSLMLGPPVTANFKVNMDVMGPSIPIRDLFSTVGGPLCYVYDRCS